MSYKQLNLQGIAIPDDSEIKKNTEWRFERAYGVGLYIQHVADAEHIPVIVARRDKTVGMKYGVWVLTPTGMLKSKRFYNKGYAGTASNIHMKIRRQCNRDYVVEALGDKVSESGIIFEGESHNTFSYQDDKIICIWTTRLEQYATILTIVSEVIEQATQAVYKNKDDEIPELNETAVVKLKKPKIYECNGITYDTLEEMYWDVVNNLLPEMLAEGVAQAMAVYSEADEDNEIICQLDAEKGCIEFKRKKQTPFFTFPCELLTRIQKWCFGLRLNQRQEASHWLDDAMKKAAKNDAFDTIKTICIIDEDLDVVFEKV